MYRFRDTLPIDISEQTISGDLVTIENPEEMGVVDSLEVSLEPIQAGSGDPSPDNVRPISGRTEVVTRVAGKNLLPIVERTSTTVGVTATVNADGSVTLNGTATGNGGILLTESSSGKWLTEGTYYGKLFGNNLEGLSFQVYNNGSAIMTRPSGSFVIPSDSETNYIRVRWASGTVFDNVTVYPMLILGTTEPTTYIAPQTEIHTTALGRTVYGGTLDVVSGVLTVNKIMLEWTSSSNFAKGSATIFDEFYLRPIVSEVGVSGNYYDADHIICSHAKNTQAGGTTEVYTRLGNQQPRIVFPLSMGMTLANFNTWLDEQQTNGTPLQVCYMLATPQTYQLTPQQIELLVGENHLWSDGEISVVWHKDLTKGRILPTEAVSINGQYIENVLEGYRTLYTKGRESLAVELNTYSVGVADGETFKFKRYPARTLKVGFQLVAPDTWEFRRRFNQLNNLLSLDEADFIFNDETDKFFAGIPIFNAEVEAGQLSVKGEWEIYCAYPFKRSVVPTILTLDNADVTDTSATFAIDYKGGQPARPVLRAKFAGAKAGGESSEDGDCGFVAFMDGNENIIQLGNPDVIDRDEYAQAVTLINREFTDTTGWTVSGVSVGSISDTYWMNGHGQTQSYAIMGSSGSLKQTTDGAVNLEVDLVQRLCVSSPNQTGTFGVSVTDDNDSVVVGFRIVKNGNGTTGKVEYIIGDTVVGQDNIDVSYYNNHFGYCQRTPVYVQETYKVPTTQRVKVQVKTKKKKKKKKYKTITKTVWVKRVRTVKRGWHYTQSNLNSMIYKDGDEISFDIGNLPTKTFKAPSLNQTVAKTIELYSSGTFNTNAVHSCLFRRETGAIFAEQPNVFTAGDIVEADCNDATVQIYREGSVGGTLEPQYGALGNDWESFMLTNGVNQIRATWSDWVDPNYKPQIEIEYNEVFI